MDKLKRVLSGNDSPSNEENSSIISGVSCYGDDVRRVISGIWITNLSHRIYAFIF